ncbi:Cytochrome c-type biogenesis protein CcmH precursor [Serratia fonticola]|uniref:Cytochrome c-type biogenesis protein CcmH n=1 Tax=Serratia fonticola TaxID=47917 RepID=A0A4V6KSS1_SERFO|nr:Cytochrome c-type biogenesis protein CcmH precursor [Serratia fonticola]
MALNNATTATQAFAHAYSLDPSNMEVRLGYAEVLTRSGRSGRQQAGHRDAGVPWWQKITPTCAS